MSLRPSNSENPPIPTQSRLPPEPEPLLSSSLGPPPSLPLPRLPPFPSPIASGSLNALLRATEPRSSRCLSHTTTSPSTSPLSPRSPTSPRNEFGVSCTASSRPPSVVAQLTTSGSLPSPRARTTSVASGASGSSSGRPISIQSIASSYIGAASEALGLSMLELDREADAMGIITPSSRRASILKLNCKTSAPAMGASASRQSIAGRRVVSANALSAFAASQSPLQTSQGLSENATHSSSSRTSRSSHLPSATPPSVQKMRKGSLRMLKPLPNLPSPLEDPEFEAIAPLERHPLPTSTPQSSIEATRSPSPDVRKMMLVTPRPRRSSRSTERGRADSLVLTQSRASPNPNGKVASKNSLRGSKSHGVLAPNTSQVSHADSAPTTITLRDTTGVIRRASTVLDASVMRSSDEDRKDPQRRRAALALAAQNQSHPPIQMIRADSSIMPPKSSTAGWMTPNSDQVSLSGSDSESSIDLHTPLSQYLLREGMLSASSTALKALDPDAPPANPRRQNNELRKRRHRDGKLLREGVGLTTGLGWSDSEDENAPGPLRRKISNMILRRTASAAVSLKDASSRAPSIIGSTAASQGQESATLRRSAPPAPISVGSFHSDDYGPQENGAITSRSRSNSKLTSRPITPGTTPDSSTNSLKSTLSSPDEPVTPASSGNAPSRRRPSFPAPPLPSPTALKQSSTKVGFGEDDLELAEAAYHASKMLVSNMSRRSSRVNLTNRDPTWSNGTNVEANEFGVIQPRHRVGSGPGVAPPSSFHFPSNGNEKRNTGSSMSSARTSITSKTSTDSFCISSASRLAKLSTTSISSFSSSLSPSISGGDAAMETSILSGGDTIVVNMKAPNSFPTLGPAPTKAKSTRPPLPSVPYSSQESSVTPKPSTILKSSLPQFKSRAISVSNANASNAPDLSQVLTA